MSDVSRRDLLATAAVTMCAGCLVGEALAESVPFAQQPKPKTLVIGKLADFPDAGFYDKFNRPNRVIVARYDDRLVALSALCTHKNKALTLNSKTEIRCPSHGSLFDADGKAIKEPAKTPLFRHGITAAADGTITVDLTKLFGEKQWDEKAAFLPIKPEDKTPGGMGEK